MQVDREWCACHRLQTCLGTGAAFRIDGVAPMQSRYECHVIRIRDENLAARIDGDAAPIENAVVSWVNNRALLGWRREDAVVAQSFEDDATHHLVERRGAPHVAFAKRPL